MIFYQSAQLVGLYNTNIKTNTKLVDFLLKIFKNNGLSITVKTNIKTGDFLDTHFDLVKGVYQPYKQPNDDPLYINIKCNHPSSILQQLPKSISKRISEISSNEHIFNQSILYYENALNRADITSP